MGMGKNKKDVVISAGGRLIQGTGGARVCNACGGTKGWKIEKIAGVETTTHTGCGAKQ
jgi:hypothetical protein